MSFLDFLKELESGRFFQFFYINKQGITSNCTSESPVHTEYTKHDFHIHTKGYDARFPLNEIKSIEHVSDEWRITFNNGEELYCTILSA